MRPWILTLAGFSMICAALTCQAPIAGGTVIPAGQDQSPGYWLLTGYGSTYAYNTPYFGAQLQTVTQSPCQGNDGYLGPDYPTCNAISATQDGQGYWVEDRTGALPEGDTGSCDYATGPPITPVAPGVGIAAAPVGVWLATSDGGVFSLCGASFHGSMGGKPLNAPIVGMAPTPTGDGYWLVGSDGGVFGFGSATYRGSMGGKPLNAPVVGIAAAPTGDGYWEVASDGGVFAFGNAAYAGSMAGKPLNAPIVGIAADPTGGYWLVGSDGGVFAFGGAPFLGSPSNQPLDAPVVGIAARP